jgi:hypothetical protein
VPLTERAQLMRSVNEGIALFATDSNTPDMTWSFVCECGSPDCAEWIELELPAYEELRADPDGSVLAKGHKSSPSERARRQSAELREEARALHEQAKLQRARAEALARRWG